jgi:hypothetical protein
MFLRRWAIVFFRKNICGECAGKLFEKFCLGKASDDLEDEIFEDD